MIKYILDSRVNMLVGLTEDGKLNLYNSEYGNIDYLYIVKEEGELDYYGQKFDVEAGDVVLRLYSRDGTCNKREIVVIPAKYAKVWVENMQCRSRVDSQESVCQDSGPAAVKPESVTINLTEEDPQVSN